MIQAAVARCDRIVAGVEDLRPLLEPVLPLREDRIDQLSVLERIASVALLKRYEQLQDMLGRLFRAYLDWHAVDVRELSRRDQANHLEKFRVVDDADEWISATLLRNRLVHEYPLDEAEQVDRVNASWTGIARLMGAYTRLRITLVERGLVT